MSFVVASIIFPNQLFEKIPFPCDQKFFLVEEESFFNKFKFHKKKLVLHRASMKFYFDSLIKKGFIVQYIDFNQNWIKVLRKNGIEKLYIIDVVDFGLKEKILKNDFDVTWIPSPSFLTSQIDFDNFFENKNHFSQTSFYINQRKNFEILLDSKNKPIGDKWTYDKENRENLHDDIIIPKLPKYKNKYIDDAKIYVKNNFSKNPGSLDDFIYPVTHNDVKNWFEDFLYNRLEFFGKYEDAICENNSFLFHSILSFALNIGLITPDYVLNKALEFALNKNIPINSLEGFIRQILGWREFIKGIYTLKGKEQFEQNFFNHQNRIFDGFYNANVGLLPVDNVIKKVINTAFANHIERLMILGNFCLLTEIHPKEVYRWFMEMFIDAYDWVMIPNIFGMSQFADGGFIVTKPYLCSSNYILKMSDFKFGEWSNIFDALYWRFIWKNQKFFMQNPRLKIMAVYLNKLSKEKLENYINIAYNFLSCI